MHELAEEHCNQQISDRHLEDFSRSSCQQWRSLPSRLGLPTILAEDIERSVSNEGERRHIFFQEWKQRKGFEATYKRLIEALIGINRREDAEKVCQLMKDTQPLSRNPPLGSHLSISIPSPGTLALPTDLTTAPNTGKATIAVQ